ncbi:MAG TPA: CerR family C-terminal domain-containing protein [Gemmataceae bacterium]|nr:CerR family C-terminal domain-containing protein [Gemmataceae bacterium]
MTTPENPRERLLDAAGEIFAEKGFKGATVREIIDRAGVNIAAVNYYFRDKERLYIEAVKHAACGQGEEPHLSWSPDTPPAQKLRDIIRFQLLKLLDPNRPAWLARLIMRELIQPSEACAELAREYIEPRSKILFGVVRELLPPGTPNRKVFLTAFSIVGQCHFYCSHKPIIRILIGEDEYQRLDPTTLAEHITQFTLRALKAEE